LDLRGGGFIPEEKALTFGILALARRRSTARWDSSRLLELALDRVAVLRAAKSFDEWIVARSLAESTLSAVCLLLSRKRVSLALRTALSQLEEIAADSYSFLVSYALSPKSRDWQVPDALHRHEEAMCGRTVPGSAARARLQRQRVLRPDELEGVDLRIGPQLPRRWRHLSWRLIKSAAAFVDATDPKAVEMCKPVPEVLLGEPPINLDAMLARLVASNDDRESLAICRTMLEWLPWSALLRLELAIRLDETGENDQARQVIIEALTLAPDDPDIWQSAAVILFRGGAHEEAEIATGIERALRDWTNS
jgi:tetratricopeptide (TPR) repeat protein